LKVDIEGSEYTALESFVKAYKDKDLPLPFGQLQIELHVWGEWDNFEKFLGWWEMLEEAGLRPFWTEVSKMPQIPPTLFCCIRDLTIGYHSQTSPTPPMLSLLMLPRYVHPVVVSVKAGV